jgi:hypothetical protein
MRGPDLACVPSVIHVGASAEQLRAAVQRRQGPGSSDGRFVTLRVCHWTAVGIRRISGQTSAVKPCACSAANCVRLRRRDVDALGRFVRSAFGTCAWRILAGCDPLARKRPAKRTKARAPSERSSASTATSRRERPRSSPIHNEHYSWYSFRIKQTKRPTLGTLIPHQTNSKAVEFSKCRSPEPRQRPRTQHAKETPSNLEGCEADERPCPDRGLDPPLELYCW